jgi:hypothetical protein
VSAPDAARHAVAAFCCNLFDPTHMWDDDLIDEETVSHWIEVADAILATIQHAQEADDE